jgi:hypothetical protein
MHKRLFLCHIFTRIIQDLKVLKLTYIDNVALFCCYILIYIYLYISIKKFILEFIEF